MIRPRIDIRREGSAKVDIPDPVCRRDEILREARVPVDAHFAAFSRRDQEGMLDALNWPHARIGGGRLQIWLNRADFATPFDSFDAEGWTRSSIRSIIPGYVHEQKVHFDINVDRHDANDEVYLSFRTLWIVTKIDCRWGIQFRSSGAPS